jgi:hypothetical protein
MLDWRIRLLDMNCHLIKKYQLGYHQYEMRDSSIFLSSRPVSADLHAHIFHFLNVGKQIKAL